MHTAASPTDWFIAARPKTLTASILPVLAAHLLVRTRDPGIPLWPTLLALCCAVLIQIGTNYVNDVIDHRRGVDNEKRTGPRRLLQSGKVSERAMSLAAHACFASAILLGVPLVLHGGSGIVAVGLAAVFFGYAYSVPPLQLAYRGMAEAAVIFFFGVMAVSGMEVLHGQPLSRSGFVLGMQFGLLATVLLVVNNIRDAEVDAAQGKRTLVARCGRGFGVVEVALCYTLAAGMFLLPGAVGYFPLTMLWLVPATAVMLQLVFKRTGLALNRTLGAAAAAHALFGVTVCLVLANS